MPATRSARSTTPRDTRSTSAEQKRSPTKRGCVSKELEDESIPVLPPSPISPTLPLPPPRTRRRLSRPKGAKKAGKNALGEASSRLPTPPRTPNDATFDFPTPSIVPSASHDASLTHLWRDIDRFSLSALLDLIPSLAGETGTHPVPPLHPSAYMAPVYQTLLSFDECIATYYRHKSWPKHDFPVLEAKAIPSRLSSPPAPTLPRTHQYELGFSDNGRAGLRLVVPQPACGVA
ncbi:hypothetical protein NBRC10512_005326 [Rhodotorula toruloides]|uniref:RHTO0S09e01860g1_1 n=2 Tax=Rhodotorula toruloides TaxID=5286 RepID=A0A061B8Q4_RHOTO|nr:uncharacterized protein RHTO_07850 [Rhodotorula toruloides NP11]EMS22979.1 hypothetical protein RHTO_07850 [Rhodotorula toruloides NP11]CDR44267.1 RHTO0S09e01860g1_1 [Rhodotorula toruloides]